MTRATLLPISTRCADVMRLAALTGAALLGLGGAALAQGGAKPAPPASAVPTDDGQWTMAEKNYAATRFSTLDQINGTNVKGLQVAFTFSTGTTHGEEAAPLVVDNTMYIVTPYPNNLYALDLTKPGAPMKWEYQPKPQPASQGVACCDVVNRGAAYFRRQDLLQHAGRADRRRRRQGRASGLEEAAGRHQQGRVHHHGPAGGEG